MNNRTEPTKAENEAAIAKLKREMREEMPIKYRHARTGCYQWRANHPQPHAYTVKATDDCGQEVTVAEFPFDDFDGGKRRICARTMADTLAEQINNA